MAAFLSQALADLARQLVYAPVERLRKIMDQAEDLYWQIDSGRNYPLDFIIFRVTRFRPDRSTDTVLTGRAVRRDLLTMVESLSDAAADRADAYDPPPRDLTSLCRQLRVHPKTIARYRAQGLFARRLTWPRGRRRLGFLAPSIARFQASRTGQLDRASRFTRIDEETRHQIVTRARRIRSRVDVSPFAVAGHLSKRMGRSAEAIRRLLLRHDRHDPRVAIFPEHNPRLSQKDQRLIYRAYRRGVTVKRLAERFKRSRNVIYRAINLQRAAALRELAMRFVVSPTFDLPDAEQVILGAPVSLDPGEVSHPADAADLDGSSFQGYLRRLRSRPRIDDKTESTLFARYNFLKFRADRLRGALSPHHPSSTSLDQIETYLRHARQVKLQIFDAFLRVVASVAQKHAAASRRRGGGSLDDLIDEGAVLLLETIETFDPNRGNRFSTYLTYALMRRFARQASGRGSPIGLGADEAQTPAAVPPSEQTESVHDSLAKLLGRLTERERLILSQHFGIDARAGIPHAPRTLAAIASELGVSTERARQIEHRALLKLRRLAVEMDLPIPDFGG